MENTPVPRSQMVIWGCIFLCLGSGMTVWLWSEALATGVIPMKGVLVLPFFVGLGLSMIFLPDPRHELIEQGIDISGRKGWELLNRPWKIAMALSLLTGPANLLLMQFFIR